MVEAGGIWKTDEVHVRRDFRGRKGAAAMGIHQAWQGRERGGGVGILKRQVRGIKVKLMETGDNQVSEVPREGQGFFGMLGRRRGTPSWADDTVQ